MASAPSFPGERAFVAIFVCGALAVGALFTFMFRANAWLAPFFMGMALLCDGVVVLRRLHLARSWPTTSVHVLASKVEEVPIAVEGGTVLEYRPMVVYEYRGSNGACQSRRLCVLEDGYQSPQKELVEAVANNYLPGMSAPAHVCPENSSWAVLKSDLLPRRRSHTWAEIFGGMLVVLISVLCGWSYSAY